MKINSPWPWHSYTRTTCRLEDGAEVVGVQAARRELEVDDRSCEVLLQPVRNGRPNAEVVGSPMIWSREWGTLTVEDHKKKMDLREEEQKLNERLEKERERKAKEAKERADAEKRRAQEMPAKVIDEKPSKVVDDKVNKGEERK